MQEVVLMGLRIPRPIKQALAEAGGTPEARGRDGKAGTVARRYIIAGLRADGLLPPAWGKGEADGTQ